MSSSRVFSLQPDGWHQHKCRPLLPLFAGFKFNTVVLLLKIQRPRQLEGASMLCDVHVRDMPPYSPKHLERRVERVAAYR
jgi:hypothetical protein